MICLIVSGVVVVLAVGGFFLWRKIVGDVTSGG